MATNSKEKQREYDQKRAGTRFRAWAAVLYEDSAAKDWQRILSDAHIEALVSPLHDSDVNEDGTPKKPHRHVMLMFPNPVSADAAKKIFDDLGAIPEKHGNGKQRNVENKRAYARYLVHMDDHEKHRYNEADVMEFGGASWSAISLGEQEMVQQTMNEIEDAIDANNIVSYRELCRFARSSHPDWTRIIRSHTIHFSNYVKSAFWEERQ